MSSQIDHAISQLRGMILSGELAPGERVREVAFAQRLAVSRTPLRLALSELEREGLLQRLPSRGFQVRAFSLDEIADGIDLRGTLEGMAARLVCEAGPSDELVAALQACIREGQQLIDEALAVKGSSIDPYGWSRVNGEFHRLLVRSSTNHALADAIAHNDRIPMAGASALSLTSRGGLETIFVLRAQADHEAILAALRQRAGSRVENLMREHAYRSRDNKRKLIGEIREKPLGFSSGIMTLPAF